MAQDPTEVGKPIEELAPGVTGEQLADVMLEGSEPFQTMLASAKKLGLKERTIQRLVQRLRAQYQPVLSELRKFEKNQFLELLEDRAHRALEYLDDYKLSEASAKDLAILVGILLEKRQLLRGEPTQIISFEERKSLGELIPLLIKEAKKRGLEIGVYKTIEGEAEVVVSPPEPERVARPRSVDTSYGQNIILKGEVRHKAESGEPA